MERKVEQVQFPKLKAPKPKRVAAYARVSSGKDAMLHSLSAQVKGLYLIPTSVTAATEVTEAAAVIRR